MRFAGTKTKRAAILTAVEDFNAHHRMAALTRHYGVNIEHDDEHLASLASL